MVNDSPRILVVDDTPENVKLLAAILSGKGYAVSTAASGAEALKQIEQEEPDLVLLDVVMPGMSGYEVCRTIRDRAETKLLPVIMVTALDPTQERVKGIEAGADDFLTKPSTSPSCSPGCAPSSGSRSSTTRSGRRPRSWPTGAGRWSDGSTSSSLSSIAWGGSSGFSRRSSPS